MINAWDMSANIPSIDAKDLYMTCNYIDEEKNKYGYSLATKIENVAHTKYKNSFDYSLDLLEVEKIANKVLPKKDTFSFIHNEHQYSNKIINVTFKYSYKEFNQTKTNIYLKAGYDIADLEFEDCICIVDNIIVGVMVNTPVQKETILLPKGFICVANDDGSLKYTVKSIKTVKNIKDLRTHLYTYGFMCNGNHYVRLKRTNGSARVGKCLFVDKRMYNAIHKWEMCGLKVKEDKEIDLAALESYISLSSSSIIDTLTIDPKSILIMPDYESKFTEPSVVIELDENSSLIAIEKETKISNCIFDGQSLIDKSVMGEYSDYGMILLRNKFFKSCCFNTNIQEWFVDNGITDINQLNGFTLAENISDIKLITTPSSVKYIKFSTVEKWLKKVPNVFGVVKHDKKTSFFAGRLVQTHYQLLNTIQLDKNDVKQLLQPSLDYISLLNTDSDIMKFHIKNNMTAPDSNIMKDKFEIVYSMMNVSDKFEKTKIYNDFRKEICRSYISNLKKGHVLVDGNYSTLFGNPYEMLLHSIKRFDGKTSLPIGHVHSQRYKFGEKLIGSRSPHISISNVLVSENCKHELIDKYFNLTEEIVCINSIGENIMEKLSGCDFDSDSILISDNKILIDGALKNYDIFKIPVNRVASSKIKRVYSNADKADLDHKISHNLIGEIINMSQELNTLLWDRINTSGKTACECYKNDEEIKEIYYDICKLNIMSCIEIDKAKKEFAVDNASELKKIRAKYLRRDKNERVIKPSFLGHIAKTKGYYDSSAKNYRYHMSTMDYLVEIVNGYKSKKVEFTSFVKLSECFKRDTYKKTSVYREQVKKIISLCKEYQNEISNIWQRDYYTVEEKVNCTTRVKEDLVLQIRDMKINDDTMYKLITYTDFKQYSVMSKLLFYTLFNYELDCFKNLLIECNKDKKQAFIRKDDRGDIDLFGEKYSKFQT